MDTRLNWTFTPTLTLELFAQPFVSTGEFDRLQGVHGAARAEKVEFGPDRQLAPTRPGDGG
jgi:hypothetical protein